MTFYRLDSTKLSFREYWQWKPGLPFLLAASLKLRGIKINSGQYCSRAEMLLPIDPDTLPDRHRVALDPLLAESGTLGFKMEFCYSVPSLGPSTGVGAALTSADRLSLALVVHSEPIKALRPVPPAYVFFSRDGDGSILATSGGLPCLIKSAPEFQVLKLRHGPLDQTWKRHAERISIKNDKLLPFRGEDVADTLLQIIQSNFDYNISRGVWAPLAEAEVEALSQGPDRG